MRLLAVVVVLATACSGSDPSPEVVVRDASLGGGAPQVLGATSSGVFWTIGAMPTLVGAAHIATLPATGDQVASVDGPLVAADELVVFGNKGRIGSVDLDGVLHGVSSAVPEAVGANSANQIFAWSVGGIVTWSMSGAEQSATLSRIDSCAQLEVTPANLYVMADGGSDRRLVRIDQATGVATQITSATRRSSLFPGGATASATYTGRIVDADDSGVLWLVEEMPSHRAILVSEPVGGDAVVVLAHIMNASGFFASATDLYWQEGAELLTAPRTGGPASIITSLAGPAGAFADGYIYYANGMAIERLRVE